MQIIPQSETVIYTIQNNEHIIDFGRIKKNTPTSINVQIRGSKITDFIPRPKCGCTVANSTVIDDHTVELNIGYRDVNIVGGFTKVVEINTKEDGAQKKEIIKIKGVVHE